MIKAIAYFQNIGIFAGVNTTRVTSNCNCIHLQLEVLSEHKITRNSWQYVHAHFH